MVVAICGGELLPGEQSYIAHITGMQYGCIADLIIESNHFFSR